MFDEERLDQDHLGSSVCPCQTKLWRFSSAKLILSTDIAPACQSWKGLTIFTRNLSFPAKFMLSMKISWLFFFLCGFRVGKKFRSEQAQFLAASSLDCALAATPRQRVLQREPIQGLKHELSRWSSRCFPLWIRSCKDEATSRWRSRPQQAENSLYTSLLHGLLRDRARETESCSVIGCRILRCDCQEGAILPARDYPLGPARK